MPAGNLALLLLATASTGGAIPSGPAVSGLCNDEADRYLRLSMGRAFGGNVRALVDQRDPTGGPDRVRARVTRDAKGRMKTVLVRPDRIKGLMIIDDGERMIVVLPHDKRVLDQDSAARDEDALDKRLKLVRKNYRLSVEPGRETIGRRTVVLTARARHKGIDSRRYLLDAETGYPLRHDVMTESGTENLFDTVSISFPDSLKEDTFARPSTKGHQVSRYDAPQNFTAGAGKARIGFEPVVPANLPFGFRITGTQLNDTPDWRSVVYHATDGLIKANVYEWMTSPSDAKLLSGGGRSIARKGGRTVMVVADGSALVRARLLDVFLATIP